MCLARRDIGSWSAIVLSILQYTVEISLQGSCNDEKRRQRKLGDRLPSQCIKLYGGVNERVGKIKTDN